MSDATSDKFEALSAGNEPADRARSEVWIDLDNGNFYFWFVKPDGSRIAEPWLSDIVTIPADAPTNTAIFEIEVEGADDDNGEVWLSARAMLKRVRRRLGIPMPKAEKVTWRKHQETLEHMLTVESDAKIKSILRAMLDESREDERKEREKLMPTATPTSAPSSVDAPPKQAPPVDKPRPKTRGEIVQEYADKVLAGEV